jgi:hypothetical protein
MLSDGVAMRKSFLLTILLISCLTGVAMAQSVDPDSPVITLERNPGYWGRAGEAPCPFYLLSIFADGRINLEPRDVVEHKVVVGKVIESRIARSKVDELILAFEMADYATLPSTTERPSDRKNCPNYRTDHSTAVTSIRSGAKITRVEHYHGCYGTEELKSLTELEDLIDRTVNIKQWFECKLGKNQVDLSKAGSKK